MAKNNTRISRLNKTKYYCVKSYYGNQYGWEITYTGENKQDALDRLKEYRENEPEYAHKLGIYYE
jgi:hypothetical protein